MPRYSEQQKVEALATLSANDGNVSATRRQLDWERTPSHKTIKRWKERSEAPEHDVDEAVGTSAKEKKQSLADRLEEIAWTMVDRIDDETKLEQASLSMMTTAFGTVVDKMRLLREEATAINEERSGDDYSRKLKDRFESIRSGADVPERN